MASREQHQLAEAETEFVGNVMHSMTHRSRWTHSRIAGSMLPNGATFFARLCERKRASMFLFVLCTAGSLDAASTEGIGVAARSEGGVVPAIVVAQVQRITDPGEAGAPAAAAQSGIERSRLLLLRFEEGTTVSENLTPGFVRAGRPEVSFDGRRVLFVGQRSTDKASGVWEIDLVARETRHVVSSKRGCVAATYLSRLFTLHAPQPWAQIAYIERDEAGIPALYTCRIDGSDVRRISYGVGGVEGVVALQNGRLLVGMETSREQSPTDPDAAAAVALFALNPDGTDLMAFTRDMDRGVRRIPQGETSDGWVVFLETALAREEKGAAILAVRRANSFAAPRALLKTPDGTFRCATPWGTSHLVVTYRPWGKGTFFGLFDFNMESGDFRPLHHDPDWDAVGAAVIVERAAPPGYSSVVRDDAPFGQLYCLDAYMTGLARESGTDAARIESVRVLVAERSQRGVWPTERRLGEVPVAEDGSFFLEVPARVPLRLETVGEGGGTLRAMRNWFWVMPGERRGCIGCHEDRALSPPNRHVKALYHEPRRLTLDGDNPRVPEARPEVDLP